MDFPNHNVLNRGFRGSGLADFVHFADRVVIPYTPRLIVLYAGGNDILSAYDWDRFMGQADKLWPR